MCKLRGELSETVMHFNSGCLVLAKSKYQILHNIVGQHINWLLLKKYGIHAGNEWYNHLSNVVTKRDGDKVTIYWDKPIKAEKKVSYNRPDVAVIDREENTWYIVDFAIPMDCHVKEKEKDKTDKHMDLTAEVRRQIMVKAVIAPIALGALGTVPAKLSQWIEKLEIENMIACLQTAVLISTTALPRRILNL